MLRLSIVCAFIACFALSSVAATPEEFFRAIRADDQEALHRLALEKSDVNKADSRGTTPLHYAAAYGSVDSVRHLLRAGADVGARNLMDATPLILGAPSIEKVRLLLAAKADPNARTKAGRTALIIAAGRSGSLESVRMLVAAGAALDAADERGTNALLSASANDNLEVVQFLLSKGAKANIIDKAGSSPLLGSGGCRDIQLAKLLLSKGADVNAANTFSGAVKHGKIALTNVTPLICAAAHGSVDLVRAYLHAGANVNAQDGRGMTPLMVAAASENQDANVIKLLLEAGADPNAKDVHGESVLDWAAKIGSPSTNRLLKVAGAKRTAETAMNPPAPMAGSNDPRRAVNQALGLLSTSSKQFFKESGCVACHHQSATARALEAAVRANVHMVSAQAKEEQLTTLTITRPLEPALLQFMDPGGESETVATTLVGFGASGIAANSLTDAAVNYLAGKQSQNGAWESFGISRAPVGESNILRTALAVKALRLYGWPARQREFEERVARARAWLLKTEPRTTYDRADLLLGLSWAGAQPSELARVAGTLARDQRGDGGWAQNRFMTSDAYVTGLSLYALHESRQMRVNERTYQRGVEYLLRTQMADGSWYVRSRSPKFQPYFQSGFPHNHDQWISATATAYAVMALAPAAQASISAQIR